MKKTIFALSFAIISGLGISALAQATDNNAPAGKEKREMRKQRPEVNRPNPFFEGITLTADQQSKFDALKKNCQQKDSAVMKEARQHRDEMKKANREKFAEMMKARQQKKRDYLNSVKAILTPEQYVTYLENIAINQPGPKHNMRHNDKQKKNRKPDFRGKRDNDRRPEPRGDQR